MSDTKIAIRRLSAADTALYRAIRLEALSLAPEAFGGTFAAEDPQPLSWFAARRPKAARFEGQRRARETRFTCRVCMAGRRLAWNRGAAGQGGGIGVRSRASR